MASKGGRFGARAIDTVIGLVLVVVVLVVAGDGERPWAAIALAWLTLWGYEIAGLVWLGSSPGKRVAGLRVAELDRVKPPDLPTAARRAAVDATFTVLVVVGWGIWALTTLGDPLGRGVADRTAGTMVVPDRARLPISTHDLPGYADGARRPRLTPRGRVGDADVRARARLRRLTDAPVLAGVLGLLALSISLPSVIDALTTLGVVVGATVVWLVCFVVDETRLVHREGATVGHELAGLVIVDVATGGRPSVARSFARAVVLGLTLYVPVLWPLLAVSALMMRWSSTGRSLHDLAGGTVVVSDPALDPETQRQRAMRMRLGRAGG